ncbi:EmrB/QacA subfamily drug resistance transporter [Nocardiopsis mwathae]|uniref:EmrB/QacA subfamily drug resistance transporter n=1 Tax=Nocardiopsis mwathae TaxID=1472723 RepID=A0A7W9YPM9_9ACTN|nr:MFS transporter [Nocardiopsis mwathae]MBB6174926.1 EmrB/QacA subfamily drug resistance transporter [Nocardiopsis mwathae]
MTEVHALSSDRGRRKWGVLGVVLLALFMDLADATIVNIVLPRMQSSLGAEYAAAQWVLAGYSLTFALALITGGRLGDIFGRKRMFIIGMAGFTLASVLCGAAPTAEILIAGRLLQGATAALMVPQVMSIIVVLFDHADRAKAFVFYGITLSLANVSGPLLGAVLTEANLFGLEWRTIFYVNIPLGVLAIVLALWLMPESKAVDPLRPDLVGIVFISLAMLAIMFPLIQGRERGWDSWTIVPLVASVPLLLLFVVHQRHRDRTTGSALVPPSLFAHRSFTAGAVVMFVLFSGLASLFLVLTYNFQLGQGWSPMLTAVAIVSWPIGITLMSGVAQRYATTHGRRVIGIGLAVMLAGVLSLIAVLSTIGPAATWWQAALPVLVAGLGMGMCVPILTSVVLADVSEDSAGAASGVANAVMQLGTAMGVAVVGMLFFWLATGDAAGAERGQVFSDAAATTLWYNAAAFLIALVMVPLLPRAAQPEPGARPEEEALPEPAADRP